ncbi:olfactory receptor 7E24 [Camelus ferus]|nr:olfactory receptor 7E24 [Camelus ferus]
MVSKLHRTENLTSVSEFFLMELSDDPELQPFLFGLFLSMYLGIMLGNLLIILAVSSDSHLHTPMYFFLSNLSLADIGFISTTVPKMIVDIQTHSRVISYEGCLTQMCIFIIFVCMDDMLLTVMAYDSLLDSQLHNLLVLQVTCFKDLEMSNFYCDPSQLLDLACSNTFTNNVVRKDAVASVVYTVVTPMLNPFIYSLRNSDVKRAMMGFLSKAT